MSQFWRRYGVNMLKEAISLPTLAFKFEMSFLKEQGLHLSNFHTQDLYQLFKDNLVGRPAIIFHRHAEKGQTKIRQSQYGQGRSIGEKSGRLRRQCPVLVGLESAHARGAVHHLDPL